MEAWEKRARRREREGSANNIKGSLACPFSGSLHDILTLDVQQTDSREVLILSSFPSHRSHPNMSPGSTGHRPGCLCCARRPQSLLHCAGPPSDSARAQEATEGTAGLAEGADPLTGATLSCCHPQGSPWSCTRKWCSKQYTRVGCTVHSRPCLLDSLGKLAIAFSSRSDSASPSSSYSTSST